MAKVGEGYAKDSDAVQQMAKKIAQELETSNAAAPENQQRVEEYSQEFHRQFAGRDRTIAADKPLTARNVEKVKKSIAADAAARAAASVFNQNA